MKNVIPSAARDLLPLLGAAVALITTPLAAQQIDSIAPLTLEQAIAMAQSNGHQARAAMATRDAAVYRNREYHSRLLPQLSMNGTIPSYNRSIIQVVQPDGTTLFRPQDQTNATLNLRLSQKLPVTGGDLFISSSLARLSISGQQSRETWSSTPFTVGIRQDIFRPNVAAWEAREQNVQTDLTDRQYLEARENIALTVTGLFFDVFNARMSLADAENNVAINDTLFTLNKGRFEVGKIGENDLLQSELALLRSRASLDGARLDHDRAVAALRLALNLPVGAPLEVTVDDGRVPLVAVDTLIAVQQALEAMITEAITAQGYRVVRAHGVDPDTGHGFISSQRMGLEVFATIPCEVPLVVAIGNWQYSHHVLPGLRTHQGPILTVANFVPEWPGLVGLLGLNGGLTKMGKDYSSLWTVDGTAQFTFLGIKKKIEPAERRCHGPDLAHNPANIKGERAAGGLLDLLMLEQDARVGGDA